MNFHSSAEGLRERLAGLPHTGILAGEAVDARYWGDPRDPASAPGLVLRPATTQAVSACLAACDAFRQPLVVQGGQTGLSGGQRPVAGEIVLSLERMKALGEIEPLGATMLAEAGVPLQTVQEAADEHGLLFGVDIGSRGTATVGGNIATNAGGIRVLRYGMFRAQVAGLEAVLADGSVVSSLRGLVKDNSGYDLAQLFIGSEGTLGVVTRALLKLHPKPAFSANACLAVPSLAAALALLGELRNSVGARLSAFELIFPQTFDGVVDFLAMPRPVEAHGAYYLIAEVQAEREGDTLAAFESCLMQALENGLVLDAMLAQSPREYQSLWRLRDACSDYARSRGQTVGGDISVPVPRMDAFVEASMDAVRAIDPETEFLVFGHLGDGNLHYIMRTGRGPEALDAVYSAVAAHRGSISAEHGIGLDKKPWLHLTRSEAEIATMRRLKRALDPNIILNRGRIFDLGDQG